MRLLLLIHVALLVLACTGFTVVTAVTQGSPLKWEYFEYLSSSGFGTPYASPYTMEVIATYIASFVCGTFAYTMAYSRGIRLIGTIGLLLCLVGAASFLLEGSHWVVNHHRSWIAHSPALMLVLAIVCFFSRPAARRPETV